MIHLGIVGNEAAKFIPETELQAIKLIGRLLTQPDVGAVVSGGCHLGGIDIWAAEVGRGLGLRVIEHLPVTRNWTNGYKERNLLIVSDSTVVHTISVAEYPPEYKGMRFKECYHCGSNDHVKSGGCWTAMRAKKQGKPAFLHIVTPEGSTQRAL